MKKKVLGVLLSAAMVVGLLGGCGAPAAADTTEKTDEGKTEAAAEGIAKEDIKVGFVHISDPSDMGYTYNQEIGTKEMREMIETCADSFKYAVEAFTENDKDKAMKVIEKESQADDLEIRLRTEHMKRLANNQCNTDAGIVYLDALVALERISDHSRNIAEEVLTAS